MKKPKYSILIPTYNKAEYLQYSIKSVLNSNYQNFELIISDDFSTDKTEEYLLTLNDKRVKIIKPPIKLTQTKNYEFLLTFARGEWVTIIGDDDGVLPLFFEKLDKLTNKFQNIKLIHTKPALYYWEDIDDYFGPRVCDYKNFFEKPKLRNSKNSLFMALAGLKDRTNLPMIYTSGIVKNELINRIKRKSNNLFFQSVIPDYYSMVALLYEEHQYLDVSEPLFWVGSSKQSAGRGTRIYEDNKNQNFKFINKNLDISDKVSSKLHKIGLSSIYFYECILKHPYISSEWKNNFKKYLVYASAKINFNDLYDNHKKRIKINISHQEFINELNFELNKNNLNNNLFKFFETSLQILYFLKKINKFFIKIKYFLLKKVSNKHIILVSEDRDQYKNFLVCNNFIKNKLKNIYS